ncbi:SDR family NAD(P)-dependent oxidoreductase [Mycobacterium sp. CVI_P3]|uniref:3-oxoacyl-[acyl-carrier-protein] reductase MabA n=1 Tax=Mycobacterium pinniadriaticum TaxID=2994102 RepID=A0ABT3SH56_9MYCO|nr:SDR family oxidoreductase [Mycobacterium pinniadriaticum]MCX2932360.1 SDR family NAD(P)-dependent oxidoreductase [Mycobacterium pinniadriaticum]MCX2938783.1 SDR family NAD(P)-dependent oxidoreductase [Mycobacterium pinniadriaticum]
MTTENELPAPKDLTGCGALIVGGTAGIGLATARALANAGVPRVVIVGRNAERGEAAAAQLRELGTDGQFLPGDATDPSAALTVAAEADRVLGGIDILMCTTAADVRPELFKDIPITDLRRILTELATPSMHMASAVLPGMRARRSGIIVNVASDAAKTATPGEAMIGAAKAAIVMFTRTIAIEEKRHGIRANALTPSLVHGTASTERITSDGFSAKLFASAAKQAALGVPDADDIAALAVFVCSPGAARLTGQAISVNGGISAA